MPIARERVTSHGAYEPDLVRVGEMLPSFCGASPKDAVGIAAKLPERQRAHLAVFCYGRVHLRELGIAIAKTCSLPVLLSAAPSDACGRAIHEATKATAEPEKPSNPYRRPVTLATTASSTTAQLFAQLADEEEDDPAPLAPAAVAEADCADVIREPVLV